MWRLLAGIKNVIFFVILVALVALLLASVLTHNKGLNAVLARTHQALQGKGTEGTIFIKLRGIGIQDGIVYKYVAKKDKKPILYATYNVLSGEVTTSDVE